jgi:TonB family protein
MPLSIPPVLRAAAVLLAAGLAHAAPAAAQQRIRQPRLLNEAHVARQRDALYPPALREGGVDGEVALRLRVLPDSTVDPASLTVLETTDAAFVQPATALTREMRFAPARVDGQAVAAWIRYPVQFTAGPPKSFRGRGTRGTPAEGTYELAAIEEMPRPLNTGFIARQIAARYPRALRDQYVSGYVILRFRVLEGGTVDSATVTPVLSTDLAFEEPAVTVVRQMRFSPARVNGRPVKAWVELPIHFDVERPAPPPADSAAAGPPRKGGGRSD